MRYKWSFVIFVMILTIILTVILSQYYKKKELNYSINFEISRIETTPALRCNLYNKKNIKLTLNSYTFYSHHHLQVGDIIKKEKKKRELTVFRDGNAFLVLDQN